MSRYSHNTSAVVSSSPHHSSNSSSAVHINLSRAWLTPSPVSSPFLPIAPTRRSPGPGLPNTGNTCFVNASVQALMSVPEFCAVLLNHSPNQTRRCPACSMKSLALYLRQNKSTSHTLRSVLIPVYQAFPGFVHGNQEDAHEFIRGLLDMLVRVELLGCGGRGRRFLTIREESQTAVHAVFSGLLRSEITCCSCGHKSCTEEPFLDLTLEVANTVDIALAKFCAREILDGQNKYQCNACRKMVRAEKRITIRRAPNVLCLVMKRFDRRRKNSKHIQYPSTIDLTSVMPGKPHSVKPHYVLTGIVEHVGSSRASGHYRAIVKSTDGAWCLKDDSRSRVLPESKAMNQQAYILLYSRKPQKETTDRSMKQGTQNLLKRQVPARNSHAWSQSMQKHGIESLPALESPKCSDDDSTNTPSLKSPPDSTSSTMAMEEKTTTELRRENVKNDEENSSASVLKKRTIDEANDSSADESTSDSYGVLIIGTSLVQDVLKGRFSFSRKRPRKEAQSRDTSGITQGVGTNETGNSKVCPNSPMTPEGLKSRRKGAGTSPSPKGVAWLTGSWHKRSRSSSTNTSGPLESSPKDVHGMPKEDAVPSTASPSSSASGKGEKGVARRVVWKRKRSRFAKASDVEREDVASSAGKERERTVGLNRFDERKGSSHGVRGTIGSSRKRQRGEDLSGDSVDQVKSRGDSSKRRRQEMGKLN